MLSPPPPQPLFPRVSLRKVDRTNWTHYAAGLLIIACAIVVRWLLHPLLGGTLPLLTLFGGVAATALFYRWRPAALAAVVGYLAAYFLFIPAQQGISSTPVILAGLVGYSVSTAIVILMGELLHRAREYMELELADREARGRRLLEQARLLDLSNDAICVRDVQDRITYWNRGAEETYGYMREEALGKILHDLLKTEFPEPLQIIKEKMIRDLRWSGELVHTRRDGRRIVVSSRWSLDCDARGIPAAVLETNNDITERKRAEADLRARDSQLSEAQRLSHIGSWHWDAATNVTVGSDELYRIYGLDLAMGKFPDFPAQRDTLYPAESWEKMDAVLRETARTGIAQEVEVEAFCGRERIWIIARCEAMKDSQGNLLGLRGTVQNISERKRGELELRLAKEQAELASKAKDGFLAQLSHELRTPLTPVLISATAWRDDKALPAGAREAFEMIERNVMLEARLIDDLLDLTRITRGKLSLRVESCDVHEILSRALEIVREEAREKNVVFSTGFEARESRLVGDPTRLQQVFWNLLGNAVKYSPQGGTVRVVSREHFGDNGDRDAETIRIEVSDDGIGFDPASPEKLFEPFFQRGGPNTGLGLGLAIARAVVDLHRGTIRGHSPGVGCGATFVVELPLHPSTSDGHSAPSDGGDVPADVAPERSMRLLVVEDHEPTLGVLSRVLTRAGHQVTTAKNLQQARAAAESQTFDAVVSDLGLPDGTGFELMREIRLKQNARGIALSGYGTDEDLQRSRDAGFSAHLVKPVDAKELRRALQQLE